MTRGAIFTLGFHKLEIKTTFILTLDIADEQPEGAIYLIPLRLEKCDIPKRLGRWQYVDLFDKRIMSDWGDPVCTGQAPRNRIRGVV